MALSVCRQMLEELYHATKQKQLAAYREGDVAAIHSEIQSRKDAIEWIMETQKSDVEHLSQRGFSPPVPAGLLEFPHLVVWVHISAIQQLHRGLMIYRFERHKLVVRYAMECARLGCDPPRGLMDRLSAVEVVTVRQVLNNGTLSALSRGSPAEPAEEDSQPLQRSLMVKEEVLPPAAVLAAFGLQPSSEGFNSKGADDVLMKYAKLLADVEDHEPSDDFSDDEDKDDSDDGVTAPRNSLLEHVRNRQKVNRRRKERAKHSAVQQTALQHTEWSNRQESQFGVERENFGGQ